MSKDSPEYELSKKITFNEYYVINLFKNFYQIPDYQREYVWGENQVKQLLNDVYDEYASFPDTEYFLGSIVVSKIKQSHEFEVIDGQQRLITLSLLINNLRRHLKKIGERTLANENLLKSETVNEKGKSIQSPILEIQYEGKDVFYDLCNKDDDNDIDFKAIEGLPGKTIFEAHRVINDFLDETFISTNEVNKITEFNGYLLNKVILIQIETPDIGNALRIFETINDRGTRLDDVDLLKNLLFRQITRGDFNKLKTNWGKFKKSISGGNEKEKPLRFLRYFIMANYEIEKDDKGDKIIREEEIYRWFVNNEPKLNYKLNSLDFVRRIQENASFYMGLVKNHHYQDQNVNLQNITAFVGNGFKQHYILLLSTKHLNLEWFNHLSQQLETLLFYYGITKEAPRDVEKKFAGWTDEIRKIRSQSDLNDFIANRVRADVEERAKRYEVNFMDLKYGSMQKYKIKYLLAKISQYVENERTGDLLNISIKNLTRSAVEIEHILPDDPAPELVQQFSGGKRDEYNEYKVKLGNLTLLEKPINDSIQRDFFANKSLEYAKSSIYLTRSISKIEDVGKDTSINRINKQLISFAKWDKKAINDRHKLLFELSKLTWRIETL